MAPKGADVPTPQRSDARRNRDAILRAADEVLTRGEAPPPLPEIARMAGVGQATVYRHFSDRRTLAVAVMREQLAALSRLVDELCDDPAGFRDVLRVVLTSQSAMRPLVAILSELPPRDRRRNADRLVRALEQPLRRAQAAGLVRPDLEPGDLKLLFAMLEAAVRTVDVADPARREAALSRMVETLVDGVCPGPDSATEVCRLVPADARDHRDARDREVRPGPATPYPGRG
jgi:AcrR family transcriptional regulator